MNYSVERQDKTGGLIAKLRALRVARLPRLLVYGRELHLFDKVRLNYSPNYQPVRIPFKKRPPFLAQEKIDFLKLDIEGAECEVLEDCREELRWVENLFVECHSTADSKQTLARSSSILSDAGFPYHIRDAVALVATPFSRAGSVRANGFIVEYLWLKTVRGLDLALNSLAL